MQITQPNHQHSPTHRRRHSALRLGLQLGVTSLLLLVGTTACQAAAAKSAFDRGTGQFAPCPDTPNCVSTQAPADDSEHAIAPLTFTDSATAAHERLLAVIDEMPRTTMITDEAVEGGRYVHVEFRSFIFRFVDDVEFFINEANGTIEFRSAARLGRSDLGVNRQRMEEIRTKFNR